VQRPQIPQQTNRPGMAAFFLMELLVNLVSMYSKHLSAKSLRSIVVHTKVVIKEQVM